jgi:hypothetical protein
MPPGGGAWPPVDGCTGADAPGGGETGAEAPGGGAWPPVDGCTGADAPAGGAGGVGELGGGPPGT